MKRRSAISTSLLSFANQSILNDKRKCGIKQNLQNY